MLSNINDDLNVLTEFSNMKCQSILKMEAAGSSKTLVQITLCHAQGDCNLNIHEVQYTRQAGG